MKNQEGLSPLVPDKFGVPKWEGIEPGQTVRIQGMEGIFVVDKLLPTEGLVRLRPFGDATLEEDSFPAPLERIIKDIA